MYYFEFLNFMFILLINQQLHIFLINLADIIYLYLWTFDETFFGFCWIFLLHHLPELQITFKIWKWNMKNKFHFLTCINKLLNFILILINSYELSSDPKPKNFQTICSAEFISKWIFPFFSSYYLTYFMNQDFI